MSERTCVPDIVEEVRIHSIGYHLLFDAEFESFLKQPRSFLFPPYSMIAKLVGIQQYDHPAINQMCVCTDMERGQREEKEASMYV